MSIIVGIDPSLTGTGIAILDTEDRLTVTVDTIGSKGRRDDSIRTRLRRSQLIVTQALAVVRATVDGATVDLVVIEYPTLSQGRQGGHLDRHGLWWLLVATFDGLSVPVVAVPASSRAKYATGKGNAGKDEVLLAVAKHYPNVDVTNNNEADALVLAAMGADALGQPLVELPQSHRAALDGVQWEARAA